MKYLRILISFFVLLCCCKARAQENTFVYKDSSIYYADTVVAEQGIDEAEGEDEEAGYGEAPDTILVRNNLSLEADSVALLKKSKALLYAQHLDSLLKAQIKKQPAKQSKSWLSVVLLANITQYIFWGLAILFIGVILFKLFFTQGFFQRSGTRIAASRVVEDNATGLSIHADYAQLASQAILAKDFRMAVRYLYLQSLQKLSEKGAIEFAADKTNYQYLRELSGRPYRELFGSITLHYEYVWYGEINIDEKLFNTIQGNFTRFHKAV